MCGLCGQVRVRWRPRRGRQFCRHGTSSSFPTEPSVCVKEISLMNQVLATSVSECSCQKIKYCSHQQRVVDLAQRARVRRQIHQGAQLFHQHAMPLFPETSAAQGTLAHSLSLLLCLICILSPPPTLPHPRHLSELRPPALAGWHVICYILCAPFMSLCLCTFLPFTTFLNF